MVLVEQADAQVDPENTGAQTPGPGFANAKDADLPTRDSTTFDYPHQSELTPDGQQVLRYITSLFTRMSEAISQNLHQLLLESLKSYSPAILNQLGLLLEAPLFTANPDQKGHWQYELSMVKAVLEHSKTIQKIFGCGEELIVDLCFMIIVSDIGKAGPITAMHNGPESIVYRIFTQAIFFERHRDWLKQAYDPTTADNLKPGAFPPELAEVIANISREPKENGAPSDFSMIFQSGIFFALPIEAYLYVVKTIALETAGSDPKLVEQAESLLTLKPEEKQFLTEIGYDPATARIRKFFTESHIAFGYAFLSKYCTPDQLPLVQLALSHHFSQGVFPDPEFAQALYNEPELLRLCAFMEILDKVEAAYHRMQEKNISIAITSIFNDIKNQLKINHPNHPELVVLYEEMRDTMIAEAIFTGLD